MPLLTWYGIVGDGREEVLGDFQIFCYSRDSVMHTKWSSIERRPWKWKFTNSPYFVFHFIILYPNKSKTKLKGQSRLANSETSATLGTQSTGRRQTKVKKPQYRKLKEWPTRTTHKKTGWNNVFAWQFILYIHYILTIIQYILTLSTVYHVIVLIRRK